MDLSTIIKTSHQHPILVYDGVCILCNGYIRWLLKRDKQEHFRYLTLQAAPQLKATLPKHDDDTVILIKDGIYYTHSDVGLMITRSLGGVWPVLSILLVIPKFIRHGVYRWIARNRYRWFGKADACLLPQEKHKHLFLGV